MGFRTIGSLLISLFILVSCTHVDVKSNIKEYSEPCSMDVVDTRPDKKMLSGSIIHTIEITPPIETVLKSKLCTTPKIFDYSVKQPIFIEITDLKYAYSDETVFIITAGVRTRGESYIIQSIGKEYYIGLPSTRIERLLDYSLDDFAKKLILKLQ